MIEYGMGCKFHTESEWSDRMINRHAMLYNIGLLVAHRRLKERERVRLYFPLKTLSLCLSSTKSGDKQLTNERINLRKGCRDEDRGVFCNLSSFKRQRINRVYLTTST